MKHIYNPGQPMRDKFNRKTFKRFQTLRNLDYLYDIVERFQDNNPEIIEISDDDFISFDEDDISQ